MPVRLATLLAVLALALTIPAVALGQGAGDDQYTDPFGSGQNGGDEPSSSDDQPSATPTPTPEPAAPAATAAPAQESADDGDGRQLPYTGGDAGLLAVCGVILLAGGVAVRVRVR
jgi:hypothetical protein